MKFQVLYKNFNGEYGVTNGCYNSEEEFNRINYPFEFVSWLPIDEENKIEKKYQVLYLSKTSNIYVASHNQYSSQKEWEEFNTNNDYKFIRLLKGE